MRSNLMESGDIKKKMMHSVEWHVIIIYMTSMYVEETQEAAHNCVY